MSLLSSSLLVWEVNFVNPFVNQINVENGDLPVSKKSIITCVHLELLLV